jgi:hypothetical protein
VAACSRRLSSNSASASSGPASGLPAAAVLLVIQFGLGTAVNLYVTLPTGKSFWSKVFGDGAVAVHAIVALLLIGAAVSALVRSIRARHRLLVVLTSASLVAIVVAAASGVAFVRNESNGASLSMALAAAVALFCYLAAIFALGAGSDRVGG